jgi:hypothetical protein
MEIDAAAKKLDNSSRLKEMVKEDHNDLNGKETAKPTRPKPDIHAKYKRPNYLYRLL